LKANVNGLRCTLNIGGVLRTAKKTTIENCSNSGDIIFEGTSKSAVVLGGMTAMMEKDTKTGPPAIQGDKGFVNTGKIKLLGTTTGSAYVGGVVGYAKEISISSATVLKNEGLVTNYDATTGVIGKGGNSYIGGCMGAATAAQSIAMVNTGKVYVRTIEGSSLGAAAYVGGAVGYATALISNAKADCDVAAIGFKEASNKEGVGMITGVHRGTSAAMVDKCKVGGRYALTEADGQPNWITISPELFVSEDAGGDAVEVPGFAPYWTKIYGGAWADASAGNCDNCTYESANPAVKPEIIN
jgi:hypothetical protein